MRIHFICHLILFCVIYSGAMIFEFEWNLIAEDQRKLTPFLWIQFYSGVWDAKIPGEWSSLMHYRCWLGKKEKFPSCHPDYHAHPAPSERFHLCSVCLLKTRGFSVSWESLLPRRVVGSCLSAVWFCFAAWCSWCWLESCGIFLQGCVYGWCSLCQNDCLLVLKIKLLL